MSTPRSLVTDPFTTNFVRLKARQLCLRTDYSRSDFDDLTQGMLLHLVEKQHLFDPARGSVEAFVTTAVTSWIRMELRYRGRDRRRGDIGALSLEGITLTVDGETEPLGKLIEGADLLRRTLGNQTAAADLIEIADAVGHALRGCSRPEQALLRQVVSLSVTGTARRRRVSRRKIERSLAGMRARFEESGLGTD